MSPHYITTLETDLRMWHQFFLLGPSKMAKHALDVGQYFLVDTQSLSIVSKNYANFFNEQKVGPKLNIGILSNLEL